MSNLWDLDERNERPYTSAWTHGRKGCGVSGVNPKAWIFKSALATLYLGVDGT